MGKREDEANFRVHSFAHGHEREPLAADYDFALAADSKELWNEATALIDGEWEGPPQISK